MVTTRTWAESNARDDADIRYGAGLPPFQVTNRCELTQASLSSGNNQTFSYRLPYKVEATATRWRFVFSNIQISSSGETLPNDTLTVKLAYEAPDGSYPPIYFDGNRAVVIAPGGFVISDWVPVKPVAGGIFVLRVFVSVDTLGKKWPNSVITTKGTISGGGGRSGDHIDTGAASTFTTQSGAYQPIAILGERSTGATPFNLLLHGSSTILGLGDTSDDNGNFGAFARAADIAGVPHIRCGMSGETLSGFLGANEAETAVSTLYLRRAISIIKPNVVVAQLSPNDLYTGTPTVSTLQTRLTRYWDFWEGLGIPIIATTWHVRTTGTFTDATGQTVNVNSNIRQEINTWIRTRPHDAIIGLLDYDAILEDPSNPGKWRSDGGPWTDDGTHSNAYGSSQSATLLAPELVRLKNLYT